MCTNMGEDRSILRMGGMAGLLAGVLILLGLIFRNVLPPATLTFEEVLTGFFGAELSLRRPLFHGLHLVGLLVSIPFALALYRGLRETNREYALGGLLLYFVFVALLVLFASWPFLVTARIAGLYEAANAERMVDIFEVTHEIQFTIAFAGHLFFSLSALALGAAMLGSRDYGRSWGGVSLLLGMIGIVLVAGQIAIPPSFLLRLILIAVFLFVFGWKVYSLSKTAQPSRG